MYIPPYRPHTFSSCLLSLPSLYRLIISAVTPLLRLVPPDDPDPTLEAVPVVSAVPVVATVTRLEDVAVFRRARGEGAVDFRMGHTGLAICVQMEGEERLEEALYTNKISDQSPSTIWSANRRMVSLHFARSSDMLLSFA